MLHKSKQKIIAKLQNIRFGDAKSISVYQLLELYVIGILKGTLTTRASSIAFSFFLSLFPFLIFVLNIIPFVPIDNVERTFSSFFLSIAPSCNHLVYLGFIKCNSWLVQNAQYFFWKRVMPLRASHVPWAFFE